MGGPGLRLSGGLEELLVHCGSQKELCTPALRRDCGIVLPGSLLPPPWKVSLNNLWNADQDTPRTKRAGLSCKHQLAMEKQLPEETAACLSLTQFI